MQIVGAEVTPVELKLQQPVRMVGVPQIKTVTAIFVRMETRGGQNAWGCGVAHPDLNGQQPGDVLASCLKAADMVPDLHPTDIEYSLSKLSPVLQETPAAFCAFDLTVSNLFTQNTEPHRQKKDMGNIGCIFIEYLQVL